MLKQQITDSWLLI